MLLHAAGLEISRRLPDKEPREFDLVFDVKSRRLVQPAAARRGDLPLGATVVVQLGRRPVRQRRADRLQRGERPAVQDHEQLPRAPGRTPAALALDWTAWGGIGMATRGSIPKIMEMAGIEMLPPEAGIAWIRRELTSTALARRGRRRRRASA